MPVIWKKLKKIDEKIAKEEHSAFSTHKKKSNTNNNNNNRSNGAHLNTESGKIMRCISVKVSSPCPYMGSKGKIMHFPSEEEALSYWENLKNREN